MRNVMVVIAIVVATHPVAGQKWTPPRTPWGDPDLQGLWPSVQMLSVPLPFERPAKFGKRAKQRRIPARYLRRRAKMSCTLAAQNMRN
jgi:hypothetical protein